MTIATTHDTLLRLCNPEPRLVTHDIARHAAHSFTGPGGHDLARWVVRHPSQPSREQLRALGVPDGAEMHTGYVSAGAQHWVYERLFAQRGLS